MSARITRLSCLLTALLVVPAFGQAPNAPEAEPAAGASASATRADVERLESQLGSLSEEVKTLRQMLEDAVQPSTSPPLVPVQPPEGISDPATRDYLETTRQSIDGLWERLKALEDRVGELDAVQGQIAGVIAEPGGQTLRVPNILGNMQKSPQFRAQVSEAVHDALPQQGTLTIENQTGIRQEVRVVNLGRSVFIDPGKESDPIPVPVGTVTTELVNYEGPRNWSVGPPNNEQRIVIKPTSVSTGTIRVAPEPLLPLGYYEYFDPVLGMTVRSAWPF